VSGNIQTVGAYALIALFLFAERSLRRGHVAASLEAGESDRGSTRLIGSAFGLVFVLLLLAPLLNRLNVGGKRLSDDRKLRPRPLGDRVGVEPRCAIKQRHYAVIS
jgi:hypothetical protein